MIYLNNFDDKHNEMHSKTTQVLLFIDVLHYLETVTQSILQNVYFFLFKAACDSMRLYQNNIHILNTFPTLTIKNQNQTYRIIHILNTFPTLPIKNQNQTYRIILFKPWLDKYISHFSFMSLNELCAFMRTQSSFALSYPLFEKTQKEKRGENVLFIENYFTYMFCFRLLQASIQNAQNLLKNNQSHNAKNNRSEHERILINIHCRTDEGIPPLLNTNPY